MCHLFEFKNKEKNVVPPFNCPEKMSDLKPISLKGFIDGKGPENFPDVFLFAVKYKDNSMVGKKHNNSVIMVGDNEFMTIYTTTALTSNYQQCKGIK